MPPSEFTNETTLESLSGDGVPAASERGRDGSLRRWNWSRTVVVLAAVLLLVLLGLLASTQVARRDRGDENGRPLPTQQEHEGAAGSVSRDGESVGAPPAVSSRRARMNSLPRLSDYKLFQGATADLQPAAGVVEYQLNTPLFTDYAAKQRLIKLPEGTAAGYTASGPLDFPVGTVIAKTFFYPDDAGEPDGPGHLVETRILEHREEGWVGLPYLWNAEQTDAVLALTGGEVPVAWVHTNGESRENVHLVPNFNDCKRCHATPTMQPLGPKAGNLNRDLVAADEARGGLVNQLLTWAAMGILTGLPAHAEVPRLADWDDPSSGTLDQRARAYLEVNCAHCHSEQGPARNSGLHLDVATADPYRLGVMKTPVAAGRGTGGRLYSIVPGHPQESIMHYRVQTTTAGEMMPEFGRSLVHAEGVALLTEWIEGME